jgi:hypothetical protein
MTPLSLITTSYSQAHIQRNFVLLKMFSSARMMRHKKSIKNALARSLSLSFRSLCPILCVQAASGSLSQMYS